MGLDMYLRGKRFLSKYLNADDERIQTEVGKMFPELENRTGAFSDESPVTEIVINAGYWRKSNSIHFWFVKNCQSGIDNCLRYRVTRHSLNELKQVCKEVLIDRSKADQLLPTMSGFFFGGTDYDEFYFQDLEYTIKIIDNCLSLPESWEFEYQSSW